ncbi:MAG: hypothetical protein HYY52_08380 [Candidatus Melainabacteria bacterium]|nr:hypothetical protein [Candidatus Melainabacteria bacterium]
MNNIITEEERYKAETYKIVGIAMLTPIGPVFLTPIVLFKQLGLLGFIIYLLVAFISFILGGIIIEQGRKIFNRERKREARIWK